MSGIQWMKTAGSVRYVLGLLGNQQYAHFALASQGYLYLKISLLKYKYILCTSRMNKNKSKYATVFLFRPNLLIDNHYPQAQLY